MWLVHTALDRDWDREQETMGFCIGGSRGGVRDARPPLGVQILSISCSFRENLACSRPPWRVHAPPSGKSWIRHCSVLHYVLYTLHRDSESLFSIVPIQIPVPVLLPVPCSVYEPLVRIGGRGPRPGGPCMVRMVGQGWGTLFGEGRGGAVLLECPCGSWSHGDPFAQTDRIKNITFPQLRCRAVITRNACL